MAITDKGENDPRCIGFLFVCFEQDTEGTITNSFHDKKNWEMSKEMRVAAQRAFLKSRAVRGTCTRSGRRYN